MEGHRVNDIIVDGARCNCIMPCRVHRSVKMIYENKR